jgi:hypothetical protein
MQKQAQLPIYTTIIHQARIKLEITNNEYCVADVIYHLSNNPASKIPGWCFASREVIADFLGLARRSICTIIDKLVEMELVEKDEQTKYLRTTKKWYESVILQRIKYSAETAPIVQKLHTECAETALQPVQKLHPDNNNYNNNYKMARGAHANKNLKQLTDAYVGKYGQEMIDAFLLYWTQQNAGGKKQLWQMQKVFDVPKRLATWHGRQWNGKRAQTSGAITLHDGTEAVMRFGRWVDARDPAVTIDVGYYPELTKR